jgi:hypothetical protein
MWPSVLALPDKPVTGWSSVFPLVPQGWGTKYVFSQNISSPEFLSI